MNTGLSFHVASICALGTCGNAAEEWPCDKRAKAALRLLVMRSSNVPLEDVIRNACLYICSVFSSLNVCQRLYPFVNLSINESCGYASVADSVL